jgi:hypothetical protein
VRLCGRWRRARSPILPTPFALIADETEKWGKVIAAANIKAE